MKPRRKKRGNLIFFVPIVVIFVALVVGVTLSLPGSTGNLRVYSVSSYGTNSRQVAATATVNGVVQTTPFNVTLTPGFYEVKFAPLDGYYTPVPRSVGVTGGTTSYAVGVYRPIPVVIDTSQTGYNATEVRAIGGITPVVWLNVSGQPIELKCTQFDTTINPGSNYTTVFQGPSDVRVQLLGTSASVLVAVT